MTNDPNAMPAPLQSERNRRDGVALLNNPDLRRTPPARRTQALAQTQRKKAPARRLTNSSNAIIEEVNVALMDDAKEAARCLLETRNHIAFISRNLELAENGVTQWRKIETDFCDILAELRKLARKGYAKLEDVLSTVTEFLHSNATTQEKNEIVRSICPDLSKFHGDASAVMHKLTELDKLIDHFKRKYCSTDGRRNSFSRIEPNLFAVIENIRGLIRREIEMECEAGTIFDQTIVGILKSLVVFVKPRQYRKLVHYVEGNDRGFPKIEPPDANSPEPEPEPAQTKMSCNVLDSLINIGKMLLEDINGMQVQFDDCKLRDDLLNYKAKYDSIFELYKCLEVALDQFCTICAESGAPSAMPQGKRRNGFLWKLKRFFGFK